MQDILTKMYDQVVFFDMIENRNWVKEVYEEYHTVDQLYSQLRQEDRSDEFHRFCLAYEDLVHDMGYNSFICGINTGIKLALAFEPDLWD